MGVQRQAWVAGVVTVISIGVAIAVNLLTSGWSWAVFAILALLAGLWVGLEVWRAVPRRGMRRGAVIPTGVDGFVPRRELTDQIVRALLSGGRSRVGITTTLAGAGGFGKTTLAAWVLRLPEVEEVFRDRYWVTVGQEMRGAALADAVNDVIEQVTGHRPGFTSPEQAGLHLGGLLADRRPPPLLVVDDVWTSEQLRPFLDAARSCTLLVTTRVPDLLAAADAQTIRVDQMNPAQARDLLGTGLTELPDELRERLLDSTGRWPLALRLANSALRRTARDGGDIAEAAARLVRRLDDSGPTALDVADPAGRERTVAATLESSLGALGDRRDRALELAIFPEDTEITLDVIALLWRATASLSFDDSGQLCQELVELSLVERSGVKIRLHDVIRTYLRHECGPERLTYLHQVLLDQAATVFPVSLERPVPWWMLPPSSEYLWRWLAYHLNGAGRSAELAGLATTPGWVLGKLRKLGPVAVAEDLALVATDLARELARVLDQIGHLLVPGDLDHAVVNALAHRLPDFLAFDELRTAALAEAAHHPRLTPWLPLPDLPDLALNRVLTGHHGADRILFAPDGTWLAAVGSNAIQVWRPLTGQLLRIVPLAGAVYYIASCALSPDGRTLAYSNQNGVTGFVDTTTWGHRDTGFDKSHQSLGVISFADDGKSLIVEDDKDGLVAWDLASGRRHWVVKPGSPLRACIDLGGGRLLAIHEDGLKIYGRDGEVVTSVLTAWGSLKRPVVSPDRRWVVVPSADGLLVWDLMTIDHPPVTLHHHVNLSAAAFLPDGDRLATGDDTGLIILWDTVDWCPVAWIPAHVGDIEDLAVSSDGTLASLGDDRTVRLWNPDRGGKGDPPSRLSAVPDLCAAAADGSWLAVSDDESVLIYDPVTGDRVAELKYPGLAWSMSAARSEALVISARSGFLVCRPGAWQASRLVLPPSGRKLQNVVSGADLVAATIGNSDTVGVWNIATWSPPTFVEVGAEVRTVSAPGPVAARSRPHGAFARRSRLRRALGRSRLYKVFTRRRNKQAKYTLHTALAPDCSWIAFGRGNRLHVWNPRTWVPLCIWAVPETAGRMEVSPDGTRLVAALGSTLYLIDAKTWKIDIAFDPAEWVELLQDLVWSPDGTMLATVADDRVLRVHDSRDGRVLADFRLDGELKAVTWVAVDRLVVVGNRGVCWFAYMPGEA